MVSELWIPRLRQWRELNNIPLLQRRPARDPSIWGVGPQLSFCRSSATIPPLPSTPYPSAPPPATSSPAAPLPMTLCQQFKFPPAMLSRSPPATLSPVTPLPLTPLPAMLPSTPATPAPIVLDSVNPLTVDLKSGEGVDIHLESGGGLCMFVQNSLTTPRFIMSDEKL